MSIRSVTVKTVGHIKEKFYEDAGIKSGSIENYSLLTGNKTKEGIPLPLEQFSIVQISTEKLLSLFRVYKTIMGNRQEDLHDK